MTERRAIKFEIAIVLALSLGASAIWSLLDLAEKLVSPDGLAGSVSKLNPTESLSELFDFLYRVVSISLGLAPVALVLYLLSRDNKNGAELLGLWKTTTKDFVRGLLVFLAIGIPGLGLYLIARSLGLAAKIVPGEFQYWWVIPVLLLSALRAGLLEEVIMVGYLYKKFDQLGIRFRNQQLISAGIRACYHAYQGLGGILGNFAMGIAFGYLYRRWGRVAPLVIAHFLLDAVSFVGYALLAKQLAIFGGLL